MTKEILELYIQEISSKKPIILFKENISIIFISYCDKMIRFQKIKCSSQDFYTIVI